MSRSRITCVLLVLITLLLYWPARHHEFLNFDDNAYVTQNPPVRAGLTWAGVAWAFTTGHTSNWHPLTWLSHMLDCQCFGLHAGPQHLVSAALHALNAALLFLLLFRLTGAFWQSAFIAAVFAWHPLRVESVAWIAERKDVLSTFFGLLTLLLYARYAQKRPRVESRESKARSPASALDARRSTFDYYLVVLFFALGLMSKPMLVTLPFVMLLLDYWPLGRTSGARCEARSAGCEGSGAGDQGPGGATPEKAAALSPTGGEGTRRAGEGAGITRKEVWALVREKWPFFALSAVSCVVTFLVQQRGDSVVTLDEYSPDMRLANAAVSYVRYLIKCVWPLNLSIIYPLPRDPAWMPALAAAAALVLITWWTWRTRRRHPYWLTGWLWFLGTLVPVIGLVQVGFQAMADRYTYLPLIGLVMAVVFGVSELAVRLRLKPAVLFVAGGIVLGGCLAATTRQIGFWRNNETVFRHALAVTENNFMAYNNLGTAFLEQKRIDEAIPQFEAALKILPNFAEAHYNLGLALARQGRLDEAISHYEEAIAHKHRYPAAYNNLGIALLRKGQLEEAITDFQQALALKPDYAEAHYNLGSTFLRQGRLAEAIAHLRRVLEISPDDAAAHNSLGKALLQEGQLDAALSHFQKAVELKPDLAEARYNLGTAFLRQRQLDAAIAQFRRAVESKPDYVAARNDLGVALLQTGQVDKAIAEFRKALEYQAGDANAHNNLAVALLQTGQLDEAIVHLQKVLELRPSDRTAHNNLGKALLQRGQVDEALRQFRKAVEIEPDYAEAQYYLGAAYVLKGQFDDAIGCFQKVLKLQPDYAPASENLGAVLLQQGHVDQAVVCLRRVLELQPGNIKVMNDLAWILATCPVASVRDAPRAVQLGEQADRLSGGKNPAIASTLAAAYAEAGRFPEAIDAAQRALQLMAARPDSARREQLQERLRSYQAGVPFRDNTLTNGLTSPALPEKQDRKTLP